MNPIAVVILLVAILFITVGFKGKQDNLISAITGKKYNQSSLT